MLLPPRLASKLDNDPRLSAAVRQSIENFRPWIAQPRPTFFPEYTDHGPEHLSSVLSTASSLIPDPAWRVVTPSDAAILALAVLLHDAAMHLTPDGFCHLARDEQIPPVSGFGDAPRSALWHAFLSEARRF